MQKNQWKNEDSMRSSSQEEYANKISVEKSSQDENFSANFTAVEEKWLHPKQQKVQQQVQIGWMTKSMSINLSKKT